MADQTITITSRINCFGPSPTQRWGANDFNTFTWGTHTWGEKSAGVGGNPPLIFSVYKVLGVQTLIASSADVRKTPNKVITGQSITPVYSLTDLELFDGSGYAYIYNDRVSNIVSAASYSYTEITTGLSSWTLVAASGSVTWS